jgi:hypothetical protein
MPMEKLLQRWRFKKVTSYLYGRVLDFGGNNGELENHIQCLSMYECVNDIFHVRGKWDNIACLAVFEHTSFSMGRETLLMLLAYLEYKGKIIITTPSKILHPILKVLAWFGLLDKKNIDEHKYYWSKKDFLKVSRIMGLEIEYSRFQFGLNQLIVLKRKP